MAAGGALLVGIDSSTQSTTACVWSASGKLLSRGSARQKVSTPRPGWAEQDPRGWRRALHRALRSALDGVDVRGLAAAGIAFQRETFALADARGKWVRPAILWLDVRASAEVEHLAREIGPDAYHELTGKPLDVTSALARLLWLRRHELAALKRAARWVDVGSAVAEALTGRRATCVAGVDTCGLTGLASRDWIEPYFDLAGMERAHFPDLVEPGAVIGRVTRAAARATGLPEGLPVVAAGGDGHVFSVAMGACLPPQRQATGQGAASLTLGTSVVLGLASREPLVTPLVTPLFRTLIGAGGGYLFECVLQSGTYLLRWFVERFVRGRGKKGRDEAEWDELARAIPPGADGLVTLPSWWGVRFPERAPDARGATIGWSDHHTPAHFYRSLVEGLSFELRRTFDELGGALGRRLASEVRTGGGGAKSRIWPSILADVLGRRVALAREAEATSLGAAVLAGVGAGVFGNAREGAKSMARFAR
ncbi:MAG: xylulokinase, partial [Planctomycetota bacterium]